MRFVFYVFMITRKPSCSWQTRTTEKQAKNCSNSTWKQISDKITTCLK